MIDTIDVVLRVGTATAAGAIVGFEREAHGQLAGVRTHALVSVGSCLFTMVGAYGFPEHLRGPMIDPMRVAAQVVSGIGFIGAGAIIRDRGEIRGVTTAAALWVSASLGMAAAAGLYGMAWLGLAAVLFALVGLRTIRDTVLRRLAHTHQSIDLTYRRGYGTLAPVISAIEDGGGHLERLRIDDDHDMRHVALEVRSRDREQLRERIGVLADLPEVDTVSCT